MAKMVDAAEQERIMRENDEIISQAEMDNLLVKISQFDVIKDYLEKARTSARMNGDTEIMKRVSRAIWAFDAPTDIDIKVVQK